MYKNFVDENGFTLVEVLLTIAMIGVMSLSVLSLFSSNSKKQHYITKYTIAFFYAKDGLEKVFADRYIHGFDYIIEQNYDSETFDDIERNVHIDNINPDLKKIVIEINWDNKSDSLVALIGNY